MKPYKMDILDKILKKPFYKVDLEEGILYGKHNKPLGTPTRKGYLATTFRHKGKRITYPIHQIIAYRGGLNILPPMTVNHKDGNKLNNSISNLEAVTDMENRRHAKEIGLTKTIVYCGEKNPGHKITLEQSEEIKHLYKSGRVSSRSLGQRYGLCHKTILNIVHGRKWARGNTTYIAQEEGRLQAEN